MVLLRPLPIVQYGSDLIPDCIASIDAIIAMIQELVVFRLAMANVRNNRETDGLWIQRLRGVAAPNTATVLSAGVLCDLLLSSCRTARIHFTNLFREALHKLQIQFLAPHRLTLPATLPNFSIRQTFLLRSPQRLLRHQQPLALISLSRPAPFKNHRRNR